MGDGSGYAIGILVLLILVFDVYYRMARRACKWIDKRQTPDTPNGKAVRR